MTRRLEREGRRATREEQHTLAQWSSWGALPEVFNERNEDWATERAQLAAVLTPEEYRAAQRTTINAHYTDPAIVREIWDAVTGLGFTEGRVLEPGSGAGTFIGMAPETAAMVGVELDPITASISRGLYPDADIRTESFADTSIPDGSFDAAIGNVPFADVTLYDPAHNSGRHSMHNHFILKSLDLTRPGGLVAVLTSSYTMDAQRPTARREMNERADLVGALRLPAGAFRRSAGTEAVTDLLIFRRRELGIGPRETEWETGTPHRVDGAQVTINNYFVAHPEHVLGRFTTEHNQYGQDRLNVVTDDLSAVPAQMHTALSDIVSRARKRGETFRALAAEERAEQGAARESETELWDGTIVIAGNGFQIARSGRLEEFTVPKTQHAELRDLIGLGESARALLNAEAADVEDTPEIRQLRAETRGRYERYVEQYGPLNRYTLRGTGRYEPVVDELTGQVQTDPVTGEALQGEEQLARITPRAILTFGEDPNSALVSALENFDEGTQTASPATMLRQRVLTPREEATTARSLSDAIALSLDRTGSVSAAAVAESLGIPEVDARAQLLNGHAFTDPNTGELVHATEYLSGNVRVKLDSALAASETSNEYRRNVDALRAVLPEPVGIEDIEARMGAVWIDPETHRDFLREILRDRHLTVENPLPTKWKLRGNRSSVEATNEWGTERRDALDIAEAVMRQRPVIVQDTLTDEDGKEREVLNPVETEAAQQKADAMQERFAEWVWEDPDRASRLADEYNRRFNAIVLRDYSRAGEYLTLPGLSEAFTLRPHQRAAVARMLSEPSVGLFHQVGAGKTLEMVVGATELRRMGMVSKPAVVVPNHMLEQFTREWLQAYPQAKILAASSKHLSGEKRRKFVARAAANDWDAVILTQEAFKRIGISPDFERQYQQQQVDSLREGLAKLDRRENPMSVKEIEKAVISAETKLQKMLDVPRDPGISFEDTGIDYLIVDEAHTYKNLATASAIQDAAIRGAKHSTDMHMKLEYLRGKHGSRVATMATATPLTNSITEAHVMQRYLRPDLLRDAGVYDFDSWAATFGTQHAEMELGPAGGFRLKQRFSRFQNVPEMLRMWHVFADVKTAEDLRLPVPQIKARASDGKREVETVVLEPTRELSDYIAQIADRAEQVAQKKVAPEQDNMLLISGDGRKAALDMRLIDEETPQRGVTKLDVVASKILEEWEATKNNRYLDPQTEEESPIPGGLQLVFCDLGTPNDTRWDAYTELRHKLVEGGMPYDQVRFIHEAKNDAEKGRIFAAARAGHIAVLMGSTQKMGVGTNVQNRMTALHHIDCPWRPADLEQRDGRGIRQGNQNPEIGLYRYVVEKSFDAYSWQTVGRKATFIAQVMRGKLDARTVDDIGDTAMSATEAKALASGNPLLLEKATADAELQKLQRQDVAHSRAQSALVATAGRSRENIDLLTRTLTQLREARSRSRDTSGDQFRIEFAGATYTSRPDAADAIAGWIRDNSVQWVRASQDRPLTVGAIGGHDLALYGQRSYTSAGEIRNNIGFVLNGVPYSEHLVPVADAQQPNVGLVRTLENKVSAIDRDIARTELKLEDARNTLATAEAGIGKPFPHKSDLAAAYERAQAVNEQLAAHNKATEREPEPVDADAELQASMRSLRDAIFPTPPSAASSSPTAAAPRRGPDSGREGLER